MATDYISAALSSPKGTPLLYHKKRGTITLPTGKVAAGETPEQACRREIMEELGVEITLVTLAYTTAHKSPKGNTYFGWHFICSFKGQLQNNEAGKHELVFENKATWSELWDILESREPA